MLNKLLKHEIKDTARIMPFLYLVTLIASVVAFISLKTGISWLRYSSSILLIFISIAVIVITLIFITLRFYQNLYSREGYLMFTLPLKPQLLLISKTIISICWFILSGIVFAGSFFFALYCMGAFESVSPADLFHQITLSPFGSLIYWIIPFILFNIIYIIGQIFFSITLSNTPLFHKTSAVSAIVIFIILNVALKIIESIFTIIAPISILANNSGVSLSAQNMIGFMIENMNKSNVSEIVLGLGGFIFDIIAMCLLFYFNAWFMNKKVSLR